ncbi:MAG TPA: serine/threonine-protein kinase [Thermoleophilaceae bacterium]|jgi:serine/threonine protein kinase
MTLLAEPPRALTEGDVPAPGYEVIAHLSRSALLDVYDVWSEERDCRCVAKLLRPDYLGQTRARRSLLDEGRLLERLTHPHVVRAYETLERPQPIVILETLGGATLAHLIATLTRRLALEDVLFLGLQLCSALRYLHRNGVLHRDLKPANVVADRGQARLIDLSLARPPGRVRPGGGTPNFMSPEQARGGEIGPPADVWGLGAVLYSAATGRAPFDADGASGRYPQLERRAEAVMAHRRVPGAFNRVVARCLAPEPGERPTVAELASELDALLD